MILELVDNARGGGSPDKVGLSESLLVPVSALVCLDNRPGPELQLKDKCAKNSFPSELAGQSPKGQQNNKQVIAIAVKRTKERIHF